MTRVLSEAAFETRPCVTHWDGASEETLQVALAPPATQCIEVGLSDDCGDDVVLAQPAPDRLSLVVTTRSAYRHSIVKAFINAMENRTSLSEDLRVRLYSALQEALMNAVLHGNLQIDSGLRGSLDGLHAAQDVIESRLSLPDIACSKIWMEAIWNKSVINVMIRDSGSGYDHECTDGVSPSDDRASGRGLAILQAFSDKVAVLNGGTTVQLEFRL